MQKQEIIITLDHQAKLNQTFQHKYIYNINKDGKKILQSYQQIQKPFNPYKENIHQFGKRTTITKE
jgi:hypothetical protein